ncbi:MAG: nucleotidyltransferase [Anaerolineae bacterium]
MDLERILRRLENSEVEFVIIGGVAAVAHGSARATFDIDLCYRRTPENLARLVDALAPLHPRLRDVPEGLPFRWDARTLERGLNFTLQTDAGAVDLLGEVAGLGSYEQVLVASEEMELYGMAVHVLTLESLIAAKRAAGRPRDLEHLLELEALLELRRQERG